MASAEKLYLGNVVTMDKTNPRARAVAVAKGNLQAVGFQATLEQFGEVLVPVDDRGNPHWFFDRCSRHGHYERFAR